jgi:hypothetical protein
LTVPPSLSFSQTFFKGTIAAQYLPYIPKKHQLSVLPLPLTTSLLMPFGQGETFSFLQD